MSLRVIAGKAKGRRLKTVDGSTTRPITDRARESLFNIIGADGVNSNWWDLFGGTGAVGIEALSRGAAFVRFSDSNRAPIETIRSNLIQCHFESQSEVRRADAFTWLSADPDRRFEYIYIAPPQYRELWIKALELLDGNIDWLADDGWVIVQIAPREYRTSTPSLINIVEFEQRQYGNTLFVFYRRRE